MLPNNESLMLGPISAGATASNFMFIGMTDWCLTVNQPVTGSISGFVLQVNNSNPNINGGTITPMSAGQFGQPNQTQNVDFNNQWVDYVTLTNQVSVFQAPFRFIRIVNSSSASLSSRTFFVGKSYIMQNW